MFLWGVRVPTIPIIPSVSISQAVHTPPAHPRNSFNSTKPEVYPSAPITPNARRFLAITLIQQTIYSYLHQKYINSNALAKEASQTDMSQLQVPVSLLPYSSEMLYFKFKILAPRNILLKLLILSDLSKKKFYNLPSLEPFQALVLPKMRADPRR